VNEFGIDTDALVRLLAAAVAGMLVGAEREATDQAAGLRTHVAVSLGASLFGIVSTLGFLEFEGVRGDTNVQVDVTRVASQVVVGIGFLGAGLIFRQGTSVRNLTTAASLWVVAAIGLACGVGDIGIALIATLVLLVTLVLLRPLRTWIHRVRHPIGSQRIEVILRVGADPTGLIEVAPPSVDVREIARAGDGCSVIFVAQGQAASPEVLRAFSAHDDVVTVRLG
jgi:putative Mg2+ transporter-C (MgtC) family protein